MIERKRRWAHLQLPPVLNSESAEDQAAIHRELVQHIDPRNIIERVYVSEFAKITFEMLRYDRAKTAIINTAFIAALRKVLARVSGCFDDYVPENIEDLALKYFTSEKARAQVLKKLETFGLDTSAIEAEAIRSCSLELERIEKFSSSLEQRRTRALANIAAYRESLARNLEESSNQLVERQNVHRLRPPAA